MRNSRTESREGHENPAIVSIRLEGTGYFTLLLINNFVTKSLITADSTAWTLPPVCIGQSDLYKQPTVQEETIHTATISVTFQGLDRGSNAAESVPNVLHVVPSGTGQGCRRFFLV